MRSRPGGEKSIRKEIAGDFALDYGILVRPPIFLKKNLMAVLAFHEKRSKERLGKGVNPIVISNEGRSHPDNNENRTKTTRHSLREVKPPKDSDDNHELSITLRSVRKKLNFRQSVEAQDAHPRKRVKRDGIQCHSYLAIWDNREGFRANPEPIYKASQLCMVTPEKHPLDTPWASIEMDEPFVVKTSDLLVPLPSHSNHPSKLALCDKYIMEIKVIPTHSSRDWPPIPILCKSEGSLHRAIARSANGFTEGILVANYANLPIPPASEVPLSVSFDRDQRTYKTKYGFEVSARWEHPLRPLERLNSARKKSRTDKGDFRSAWRTEDLQDLHINSNRHTQLDDSSHPVGETSTVIEPKISYHLGDSIIKPSLSHLDFFDTAHVHGFRCPACNSQKFKSLKSLRFHLVNNHERYRFELERQEKDPHSGVITVAAFKVDFAEINRERAANHVKDERDFVWSSPDDAFNVDDFLGGDTTWVGVAPKRRKPLAQESTGAVQFKPTSAVPPVTNLPKKRHKVPKAKTRIETPLFRSVSHQIAPKGESFSESDDELDQSWLEQIHSAKLDDLSKLTSPSKAFLSRFDAHLIQENYPSTRYLSDSLVRFTRANKELLKDPRMLCEFSVMASQLIENGLTNVQVLSGCMAIIHGKQTPVNHLGLKNVRKAAKSRMMPGNRNEASGLVYAEISTLTPIGACAVCRAFVRNNSEHIICSNIVSALNIRNSRVGR